MSQQRGAAGFEPPVVIPDLWWAQEQSRGTWGTALHSHLCTSPGSNEKMTFLLSLLFSFLDSFAALLFFEAALGVMHFSLGELQMGPFLPGKWTLG